MRIAAALIIKNEERKLARCLESIKPYVDQILLADTGSTDNSVAIAKSFDAKIYHYQWTNDFSAARNYILDQSTADYNLVIDADEWVVEWDRQIVTEYYATRQALGYIGRRELMEGIEEQVAPLEYIPRFLPNEVRYQGMIHEQPVWQGKNIKLPILLNHDGYDANREATKFDRNLDLLLEALQQDPEDVYYNYQTAKQYISGQLYKQAAAYLEKSYQLMPKQHGLYMELLELIFNFCTQTDQYELAMDVIEKNEPDFRDSPRFYFFVANVFIQGYFYDRQKYQPFLGLSKDCLYQCISLGDKKDKTLQEYRGLGSYYAMYCLAEICEKTGDQAEAIKWYQQSANYNYQPAKERLQLLQSDKE